MTRTRRNQNYRLARKEPYVKPTERKWRMGYFDYCRESNRCTVYSCPYRDNYINRSHWTSNPYFGNKEPKFLRKTWWRRWRKRNRVKLKKTHEIEPLPFRTQGWMYH